MVLDFVKNRLLGTKPTVPRAQVMASRPVRNPSVQWERVAPTGTDAKTERPPVALLRIPRRADKSGNLVAKLFKLPDHRKLELDEIGSDVWEMCDGTLTVEALTKAVCAKWRLNRRQGETSVTAYLRMLAERRLIAVRTSKITTQNSSKARRSEAGRRASVSQRKQKA